MHKNKIIPKIIPIAIILFLRFLHVYAHSILYIFFQVMSISFACFLQISLDFQRKVQQNSTTSPFFMVKWKYGKILQPAPPQGNANKAKYHASTLPSQNANTTKDCAPSCRHKMQARQGARGFPDGSVHKRT